MKLVPYLHVMPRVDRDIKRCLAFIRQQLRGKPNDRKLDIRLGIEKVLARPKANRVGSWRPETGSSCAGVMRRSSLSSTRICGRRCVSLEAL